MSETIVKFECNGCDDGPCTAEYKTSCPVMAKNPTNCLYDDMDGEPEWERVDEVEQSTEGDSMQHVPVIHEKSEVAEKKWEYSLEVIGTSIRIVAVEENTGDVVARFIEITNSGEFRVCDKAAEKLSREGYSSQGLKFNTQGGIGKCVD